MWLGAWPVQTWAQNDMQTPGREWKTPCSRPGSADYVQCSEGGNYRKWWLDLTYGSPPPNATGLSPSSSPGPRHWSTARTWQAPQSQPPANQPIDAPDLSIDED